MSTIRIEKYQQQWKPFFIELNKAWIEKYFHIETSDLQSFDNAENIEAEGGAILFAFEGEKCVGTIALKKISETEFELCKFAVDESCRGKGVGTALMDAILRFAKKAEAKHIFLEGNTKLEASIHLYRKYGFVEKKDFHSHYTRVNIVMEKYL